ncbi:hypothetical protein [Hyphococcus sp.]|uniref:hypothetical protein n=1 Tax=Hyphococcus sp. TaxID=2038636 RepID=UPI0035C6F814
MNFEIWLIEETPGGKGFTHKGRRPTRRCFVPIEQTFDRRVTRLFQIDDNCAQAFHPYAHHVRQKEMRTPRTFTMRIKCACLEKAFSSHVIAGSLKFGQFHGAVEAG